jgi:hypothetical protein
MRQHNLKLSRVIVEKRLAAVAAAVLIMSCVGNGLTRVPPPDKSQYETVRDAADWKNPFLIADYEGIRIRTRSAQQWRLIPLANLRPELLRLPRGDWRYGRIVAIQTPSIGPGFKDARFRDWMSTRDRSVALAGVKGEGDKVQPSKLNAEPDLEVPKSEFEV